MINATQDEIMSKWPKEWNVPLVSIRSITYNHEPYISQALDGFLMQKTDFPFEIVVHDDASTDKTADIIRAYEKKYPQIIKPIYEIENQYSKNDGSIGRKMNPLLTGKYIAFCEGDDFWIDPQKLQKQVDFLENNPDYGMCYTDFNIFTQKNNATQYSCFANQPQKYPTEYSLQGWIENAGYVAPMTWVVRRELWFDAAKQSVKSPDGTFVLFAFFLFHSKVFCLKNETTATYRVLEESAVHSKSLEKLYTRMKSLHLAKRNVAILYLKNNELTDALKTINRKYYRIGLKLFVAMNDAEEIEASYKWVTATKSQMLLRIISRIRLLRFLYNKTYRLYLKRRT